MSEMVILTQLARKLNLTFRLLVPPSIMFILVINIGIFVLIPTLTIVFTLFPIPSRLLVSLLVRRLHREYTHCLGGSRQSRSLSRRGLVNRKLTHLFRNRVCRFGTCTSDNAIDMWSRFDLRIKTRMQSVRYDLI